MVKFDLLSKGFKKLGLPDYDRISRQLIDSKISRIFLPVEVNRLRGQLVDCLRQDLTFIEKEVARDRLGPIGLLPRLGVREDLSALERRSGV